MDLRDIANVIASGLNGIRPNSAELREDFERRVRRCLWALVSLALLWREGQSRGQESLMDVVRHQCGQHCDSFFFWRLYRSCWPNRQTAAATVWDFSVVGEVNTARRNLMSDFSACEVSFFCVTVVCYLINTDDTFVYFSDE